MLPLLTGIAVGVGAVVAYNNKEELKEKIASGAKVVKDSAVSAKDTVVEKVKSKTSKKDEEKDEQSKEVEKKDDK